MIRTWALANERRSFVLAAEDDRLAGVVYWGPRLPENEDLSGIARAGRLDVTGGMLDHTPELSICPEATRTFPGQPGLILQKQDGEPLLPSFRFMDEDTAGDILTLSYRDAELGLTYRASFSLHPDTDMLTARSYLEAERPIRLHWLSAPVFPAPQLSDELIDFSGRWCGEFQINRVPWSPGLKVRENRTGRSGHEHFPGLFVPCRGTVNTSGAAYGFHYAWSGGHRCTAEELPDGRRQIQFGNASGAEIEARTAFESAPLYAVFSDAGLNGCAVAFQRHLRDEIVHFPDPVRPRPVHYNCWEAVYFNHDMAQLKDIAERAAALGAERFILDDGWFGRRDDDTSSLGDWVVDRRKFPQGLGPLIEHVHGLGLSFGLWFEPEMVSPDSDTYRAHPDWALGREDQILGRGQKVLDMARDEVREFLFERIGAILNEYAVDYIKWDHNRVLPAPDSSQTRGTYALIDRLRAAFPALEIETCASGGGRIDFGMLSRTHRVWLSDSNDALERLRIQHNAALFLPSAVVGSHVGPRRCHTSGRVIDMSMRAWVAAQRHMGFELDPRELEGIDARVLGEVIDWWKANRDWMMRADILRLDSADPMVIAEQQLAEGGGRFVVFAGLTDTSAQIAPRPLRLTRLDPQARYRIEWRNRAEAPNLSRGDPALKSGPVEASGRYLMHNGLTLPWQFPLSMHVIEGTRL